MVNLVISCSFAVSSFKKKCVSVMFAVSVKMHKPSNYCKCKPLKKKATIDSMQSYGY